MKFALNDDNKVVATKGSKGFCLNCGAELIAKCGTVKMHHWAHKGARNCDPWWENETEWHRSWKNNYKADWQEVILVDQDTRERHIADVRTDSGLIIEFQHSNITPIERVAREKFYANMVWVIDGARLKGDYPRFLKARNSFRSTNNPGVFLVDILAGCFPSAWVGSSVPVVFDFMGSEMVNDLKDPRNYLYCLFPKRSGRYTILATLSRQNFIHSTITGEWLLMMKGYIDSPALNQQVQQSHNKQDFSVKRESSYVLHKGRFIKRRRL